MTISTRDPRILDEMSEALDQLVVALTGVSWPSTVESTETHGEITEAVKSLRSGIARLRLGQAS